MEFSIVGVTMQAGPEYQAVPKGIASQVTTGFLSNGEAVAPEISAMLPQDWRVVGDLTGPSISSKLTLTTSPGQPFQLPTFPLLGTYTLSNIRVTDGAGKAFMAAVPQAVTIESINDPLVTSVTTRPLTLEEIRDRGVVVDSTNFTAYEFTGVIGTESGQQPFSFPVLIPDASEELAHDDAPNSGEESLPLPAVQVQPPELPENVSIEGFILAVGEDEKQALDEGRITLPPIPGIIVIPNNIGFLNQYFSALLMVSNGAPGASGLTVKDLTGTVILPPGEDHAPDTTDDPLAMAGGGDGAFPATLPVAHPGPDGKLGTADDSVLLRPGESGQADFTIEGKREGTHRIDFDIKAVLDGLPIGPVTLTGKASGAVLVRNPDFSITLGHPATVRSGEAYDLFVTVTNTSKSTANLVSLRLDQRALSGAVLASDERPDRQIETILPGSSGTVKYGLVSQRTGKVTATAFAADPNVTGRFTLRLGVGELGIPLSPDSLIIPYTGALPAELIDAAVGLLGQAWSVATAPAGSLPPDVPPIARQTVSLRANDLSEAGLRVLYGDSPAQAVEDLAFDFLGSDNAVPGFDSLRRRSTQGLLLNSAIASVFRSGVESAGLHGFQSGFAELESYRPGHISIITSGSPVRARVSDASGRKVGGLAAGEEFREIPYSDQLILSSECSVQSSECTARSTLSLITKIESVSYRADFVAEGDAAVDIGVVIPAASGTLTQARFSGVPLPAGSRAWIELVPNTDAVYALSIDANNDGAAEATVHASVIVIPDSGPRVAAATQLSPGFGPGGDKHGRNVAVLFSERVTTETARNSANYAVEENAVRMVYLQPSGRMAFLLLRDGIGPLVQPSRAITVSGLVDPAGNGMDAPAALPITITAQGPAALVTGRVLTARGEPVPNATVRLVQWIWKAWMGVREAVPVIFSEKQAGADGAYRFDYVFRNDDPMAPFMIEAVNPATDETGQITGAVLYHGQRMELDVFMKARGSVAGTVWDEAGNPAPNVSLQLTTLNDQRAYGAVADASGAFSFQNVRVGAFRLKAVSRALYAEGVTMGTLPEDGGTAVQDVTIYRVAGIPTGDVAGKVLDFDGNPREGAVVVIRGERYQNWTLTGPGGSYTISGVYAGVLRVEARDPATGELATVGGELEAGETAVFNVILKGTGAVECNVVRGDGLSSQGFTVIARSGQAQRAAVTDAAGMVRFTDLPVGGVSLSVPDPGTGAVLAQGTVSLLAPGETAYASLFIPAGTTSTGSIRGVVKHQDGSVWPFAEVRLATDPDDDQYKPYRADGQGRYVIPDPDPEKGDVLPLDDYYLIVRQGAEIANARATLWYDGQEKTQDLVASGTGAVAGTVYDAGPGMMPVGADVYLFAPAPTALGWLKFSANAPAAAGKSDPQTGEYAFSGVYAGNVTVKARNIFRPTPVSAEGTLAVDGQVLTLDLVLQDTFGSVSGNVLLPDGKTAASEGVRVTVRYGGADVTVTTGTDGKFAFMPVIPAGNYTVLAEDPATTLKAEARVSVPAGKDVPVDIRLLGRGGITVTVVKKAVNADGSLSDVPVPEAQVAVKGISFPQDAAEGATDATGSAAFSNLNEGSYTVSAVDGFNAGGRAQVIIPADNTVTAVTVKLADSGSVTGRFLNADGVSPVPGGQVKLLNSLRQVIAYGSSSSDSSSPGAFRFEHVPLGDFTLEGFDPVTDRKGTGGGRLTADGQTAVADVAVAAQGTVKGVVLNNAGSAPVNDASVSITVTGATNWSYTTVTAPDGGFVFAGAPAGRFSLAATDPATNLRGSASGSLSYEGEVALTELRLQSSGSLSGRVFLPGGETPMTSGTVSRVYPNTTSAIETTTVDDLGFYRFDDLPAGATYHLIAKQSGRPRAARATATLTYEGELANTDIVLQGIGTVEGTLFDSDGSSLAGGHVVLSATGPGGAVSVAYNADTGPSGTYRFTDVPVGTFTLQGTHPERSTAASASGALTREDELVTQNLTLGPVSAVSGMVLKADGSAPAAGGGVRLTCGYLAYSGIIDSSGKFLFSSVPVPCSLNLYLTDAEGLGIGYYNADLTEDDNGTTVDIGTVVLDDRAIAVSIVSPEEGAVNVPADIPEISITFTEPADTNTVNSSTVYVMKGSTRMSWPVSLSGDGTVAAISPRSATPPAELASFTLYTVVVTTGVKDGVGRPLTQPLASTFTTRDGTPPAVVSVSPANGTTEAALDGVVRVAFSESVDPAFAGGVKLQLGSTQIDARLDLVSGNTAAVLTPYAPLLTDSTYTVSVSGVRDAAGNEMATPLSTTFNTIDTIAPAVTGLTATGDLIKGNTVTVTAAVPDADAALVNFFVDGQFAGSDSAGPSFTYSLPLAREGQIIVTATARDKAGNQGVVIEQSTLRITAAADEAPAVSVTSPAQGGSIIAGATLSVAVTATDDLSVKEIALTASGEAAGSQSKTNLSGKIYPASFDVPIPATATPGNNVQLTAIARDSAGNTAQAVITLTVAADQAPTVGLNVPAEASPGGFVYASVLATDDLSLKEVTLIASGEAQFSETRANLSGTSYPASFAVPIPSTAGAGESVRITVIVKDSAGNTAQTTGNVAIHDDVPPAVTMSSPGQAAPYGPGVAGTASFIATDNVGVASVTCSALGSATGGRTFTVNPSQKQISESFGFQVLANAAPYSQITLSCIAQDAAGNQSSRTSDLVLTVADTVRPSVVSATIQNNSTTVPADAPVSVLFSETLAPATVNTASVGLVVDDGTGSPVPGSVVLSADRKTVTFTQAAPPLEQGTRYAFTITTGVTDDAGNALVADYVLRFTVSYGVLVVQNEGTANSPYMISPGGYTNITIINSTARTAGPVASGTIDLTNSTLSAKEAVSADSISLKSGSTLTHEGATTTETWMLDVTATTMNIDDKSSIDATGKGYLGAYQGGNSAYYGMTRSANGVPTTTGGSTTASGGSYGGLGGRLNTSSSVNAAYGDLMSPNETGSGGGVGTGYQPGGNGGGLILLKAGTLTLDGGIIAEGKGVDTNGGGGSGGGIRMDVVTLSGGSTGRISAKGGSSAGTTTNNVGAGGGGRIAVYYTDISGYGGSISAAGGRSGDINATTKNGGAGTVYLKSSGQEHGDLVVNNNNMKTTNATPITTSDGTVFNSVEVEGGAVINMTGGFTSEHDVVVNDSQLTLMNSQLVTGAAMTVSGDLTLDNSGLSVTDRLMVSGEIALRNESTLSHAGATPTTVSRLDIDAKDITIESGSKINVTGKGYLGWYQGADPYYYAYGMTRDPETGVPTVKIGSAGQNGGSYGGSGGKYSTGKVNSEYGDPMNPNEAGSGGGAGYYYGLMPGGSGGGLVRLNARGMLTLDGSIIADGQGADYNGGSGSGGGIRIEAGTLSGGSSGSISAQGGSGVGTYPNGGAGGGGRIAVYYTDNSAFAGSVTAEGGKSGDGTTISRNGQDGTVHMQQR
jgi:hypothetical protein